MTTTTANAGPVMEHLEMLLAVAWPELKVSLASVTDEWAGVAVAGPKSRQLLPHASPHGSRQRAFPSWASCAAASQACR